MIHGHMIGTPRRIAVSRQISAFTRDPGTQITQYPDRQCQSGLFPAPSRTGRLGQIKYWFGDL